MTSSNGVNLEAECAVVGAMMLAGERIPEVSELLAPDNFHDPRHRILFRALVNLSKRDLPVDFIHLGGLLRDEGTFQTAGGNEYMIELRVGAESEGVPAVSGHDRR